MTGETAFDEDILIAGGGMAGATLALALRTLYPGVRITVVEPAPLPEKPDPEAFQPSFDSRSTALSQGSARIYRQLGLWDALAPRATPIRQVHVSYRGRFGQSRLDAAEEDVDALGYVVDNGWLGLNLLHRLRQDSAIQWFCPAGVEAVARLPEEGVRVTLSGEGSGSGGQTRRARLLVVADGGRSGLREQLGFEVSEQAYGQQALIANLSTTRPHEFVAYERFTPEGPVALLPRGPVERAGRECALVWTLPTALAEERAALSDPAFLETLQSRFGWRLGRLEKLGRRHHYPLSLKRVLEPVQPGVALVGNAAHSLHPVAGQGFNLALRGLMRLARALAEGQAAGAGPGALPVLERYWQAQRPDVDRITGFSDSLARFLGSRGGWLGRGRDLGLVALDLMDGPRHWFSHQAMGLEFGG